MTLLGDFFEELDGLWSAADAKLRGKTRLRLLGSAALMFQTSYARGTKDSDILETNDLTEATKRRLLERAGKGSQLHTKHRIYLELVPHGLPFLPQVPIYHPATSINGRLQCFDLEVLDVIDVVVSKLARFHGSDRDDISAMVDLNLVPHARLVDRFREAADSFAYDARASSLPKLITHLHVVERDFLDVPESDIELPDWLDL